MFLRPEKMVRIRIIGSNSKKEEIISALHDVGIMQLEQTDQKLASVLGSARPEQSFIILSEHLQKFRGYQAILPPRKITDKKFFNSVSELLAAAKHIETAIDEDLEILKSEEESLRGEIREISNRLFIAEKLLAYDYNLNIFNTDYLRSYLVKQVPKIELKSLITTEISNTLVVDLKNGYYLVTITSENESAFARFCQKEGLTMIVVPAISMNIKAYYTSLKTKLSEYEQFLKTIEKGLNELSDKFYKNIAQIREQLEIEVKKLEVSQKLVAMKDIFLLEGWIPEKYFNITSELLEKVANELIIIRRVNTKELPPTLLNNPRKLRFFEFLIKFYSIPKEYEIDPTLIFAMVFPFFFGLMVGDWGYGLTILLASLWIHHRLEHPVARSRIPRKLTRFVLMIMRPHALNVLTKALIPSSIVAIVIGLLFNDFFGFRLLPITVFDVTAVLPKLLLLSGYIGVAMVSLGLIFGLILELEENQKKRAIGKIGWLLFAWGIVIFGLKLIHHSVSTHDIYSILSISLMIIGVLLILISERAQGMMEIPSIISHILSYTRIVGILLASVILAEVIDLIFLRGIAKSPVFAVIGIIILIFGQIFNLVIAVFEPGIQGARLIYVEFFSKFYRGNGKIFQPFTTSRNYTIKKFELEPVPNSRKVSNYRSAIKN